MQGARVAAARTHRFEGLLATEAIGTGEAAVDVHCSNGAERFDAARVTGAFFRAGELCIDGRSFARRRSGWWRAFRAVPKVR